MCIVDTSIVMSRIIKLRLLGMTSHFFGIGLEECKSFPLSLYKCSECAESMTHNFLDVCNLRLFPPETPWNWAFLSLCSVLIINPLPHFTGYWLHWVSGWQVCLHQCAQFTWPQLLCMCVCCLFVPHHPCQDNLTAMYVGQHLLVIMLKITYMQWLEK